jgi:glutamate-1-semialdehyde 2,1-aminomutase
VQFPSDDSRSRRLNQRAQRVLPGGNTRTTVFMKPYPVYAAYGKGCRVWDVDGVERIDCSNNFTAAIHGYAHPELIRAAENQLNLGTAFGLPTLSEIELAELLVERVASVEHCRFVNSGTEAVMNAIKAARAYTGKPKIAKCEGAYHGTYDYAEVSLDSQPDSWGAGAPASIAYAVGTPPAVMNDVIVIPYNQTDRAVEILRTHASELAGVLVDPMPNRAGLVPADPAYMTALREVASECRALLIVDEVITFRLGFNGAQPFWNVEADLTTFGKIIGGGFPVGAVGGRRDVMEVFDPSHGKPRLPQGGTFSANPMSMRCGLAAMQLLQPETFQRLAALGEQVREGISAAFQRTGVSGQTTGMGSLLKIHFTDAPIRDYRTALPTADMKQKSERFSALLLNEGVLLGSSGLMALSTPMTSGDADQIVSAVEHALRRLL